MTRAHAITRARRWLVACGRDQAQINRLGPEGARAELEKIDRAALARIAQLDGEADGLRQQAQQARNLIADLIAEGACEP